jgi:hypothetical protein
MKFNFKNNDKKVLCHKTSDFLYMVFFIIFAVLVASILFMSIDYYFINFGMLTNTFGISIVFICFFLLLIFLIYKLQKIELTRNVKYLVLPFAIFFIALIVRLIVIHTIGINTTQVSDFAGAYASSKIKIPIKVEYYAVFSNWGMYTAYLKLIHKIFGDAEIVGIIMNCVLSALTTVCIYFFPILANLKKSTIIGFSGALLYALWPIDMIYTILLTPEYVHVFLLAFSICICLIGINLFNKMKILKAIIFFTISSSLMVISGFFKSVDRIMLIAMLIVFILIRMKNKSKDNLNESSKINRLVKTPMIMCVFFVIIFAGVRECSFLFLDQFIGYNVNRDPSIHYINIGLNSKSQGCWNADVAGEYIKLCYDYDFNYQKASNEVKQNLKKDIKENKQINPRFVWEKVKRAWQGQNYTEFSLATTSTKFTKNALDKILSSFQLYYIYVLIFMLIGTIYEYKNRDNNLILLFALFIFGFTLLMIISENQPRYKLVTYPYVSIIAGYGITQFTRKKS